MAARYITPSSDTMVYGLDSFHNGLEQPALAASTVHFCSDCGALVYRTDLHDRWHEKHE